MRPVEFTEQTMVFAKDQPQYIPLPAFRDETGLVITKWRGSFFERLRFLFSGTLWLRVLTFNHPIQPLLLETKYPFKNNHDESLLKKVSLAKWLSLISNFEKLGQKEAK